ncbi:hypothetical protein RhiirB3_442091 [Rhizophagus irregularis]|nr:hypothetical protein RhiirB3_442091 [Rhizophagus irregularis]
MTKLKLVGDETEILAKRSPFTSRSTYAIKKIVRKIVPSKAPIGKASSKRTKKVNYVYQDEVEDPEASEEEYIVESEVDSEEEEIENDDVKYVEEDDTVRSEVPMKKKSSTSKSHAESAKTKRASGNITMATEQMKKIALKSMVSSVVLHCPKKILVEIAKFLNMIYSKLKGHCLNTVMPNDTIKRRELAWENVNSYIQDILLPLLQAVNTEQKPLLQVLDDKESIHNLNEENLADSTKIAIRHSGTSQTLRKKINITSSSQSENPSDLNADDVATIYCKIGSLEIPCAMIDTGSDSSIFSDNIAELVEELLVVSKSLFIGTMEDIPITIGSGENTTTITDEFSVVPAEKN